MAVVARLSGAFLRAVLMVLLVATPSLVLADIGADTKQMVALIALFLGVLTFVEYGAVYPGLIEFRHAPPLNRIRFLCLFLTVFLLSVIERGRVAPSDLTLVVDMAGRIVGTAIDFPYSPVRLFVLTLPENADHALVTAVRTAAGISYLISLVMLTIFVILIRMGGWPDRGTPFNVWVNLPTFDPTAGGDVIARLRRDANVNIALGFLLPFLVPAVMQAASKGNLPVSLDSPQVLIWTMAAWSFLPASLFMRGIAMARVAELIREQRRRALAGERARYAPA
ncbi:MAG: hypothetical protein ACK4KW_02525 [Gemmobacter sp.]